MQVYDLLEARPPETDAQTRHKWLEFIHMWMSGQYMGKSTAGPLEKWTEYRRMFPTGLTGTIPLYRVCTIPTNRIKPVMRFDPTVGVCSSWSKTKRAMQFVAGIAREKTPSDKIANTSRIGICANIPAGLVLATPKTIKQGFLGFSKDYHDKYPMVQPPPTIDAEGYKNYGPEQLHPDWPGSEPGPKNAHFDTNEVGFLQDRLSRPGGFYGQHEYVVQSPSQVTAQYVKTFRSGHDEIDPGWEE